jgi:hypothetical protein
LPTRYLCLDCGRPEARTKLPHRQLCLGCRRRRHYHPAECPTCHQLRPLAYPGPDGATTICAGCAGLPSIFACVECGREDHPYSYTRCARCWLRKHLTAILTNPRTGQLHPELVPVFDALLAGKRPQTTLTWLTKPGSVAAEVLHQFASGVLPISHDTFRHQLPQGRRYDYIRTLLTSTGVLPPVNVAIERITPWLARLVADQPAHHAEVINRYAHWHVLRRLRRHAAAGSLTATLANGGRTNILAAVRFADWAASHGTTIPDLSQPLLERYLIEHPGARQSATSFVHWLNASRTNTGLKLPHTDKAEPALTMSDQARWEAVELLLNDDTISHHSRVAGLFMLLFSWPLNEILTITHDRIEERDDGRVLLTFDTIPIELPPGLSQLVIDEKNSYGAASYTVGDTAWLFPGRMPGSPMTTELIRRELVSYGIHPRQSRTAALFALASQIPAPVLAEITGISQTVAVRWAALAARDWAQYTAYRATQPD